MKQKKWDGVWHQSSLNMFMKCAKQFEFRYMKGMTLPPGGALTIGSSVDEAISYNLTQKMETGVDVSLNEVVDVAADTFEAIKYGTVWDAESDGNEASAKDMVIEMVSVHHRELAPKINPIAVQKYFEKTVGEIRLAGTIDYVEKGVVVDLKTSKRKYDADKFIRPIQPTFYSISEEINEFRYDVIIKPSPKGNRRSFSQQIQSKITPSDKEFVIDTLKITDKMVTAGLFPPVANDPWWCSKKWCGYWNLCKGKK